MQESDKLESDVYEAVLFDEFRKFLQKRGATFLDFIVAPNAKRNRICDEFKMALGGIRVIKPKSGRPRKLDIDSIMELTHAIDNFKSDWLKKHRAKISDNNLRVFGKSSG